MFRTINDLSNRITKKISEKITPTSLDQTVNAVDINSDSDSGVPYKKMKIGTVSTKTLKKPRGYRPALLRQSELYGNDIKLTDYELVATASVSLTGWFGRVRKDYFSSEEELYNKAKKIGAKLGADLLVMNDDVQLRHAQIPKLIQNNPSLGTDYREAYTGHLNFVAYRKKENLVSQNITFQENIYFKRRKN